jgi:hypothetical protein
VNETQKWATSKKKVDHELSLHDLNVGVWYAINAQRMIQPIFSKTVSSKHYARLIQSPFFKKLSDEKIYFAFYAR